MVAATECDTVCWLTNPLRNQKKEKEEKDESKEMVGLVQTTGTRGVSLTNSVGQISPPKWVRSTRP